MFYIDFVDPKKLRIWLKGYTIVSKEGYKKEAEIINRLIPAMVDSFTDDELIELFNEAVSTIGE